ncbi:hypothetical protein SI65_07212 [Aspergillus cristatus]|uniref:Uncharacterized protein n=1 Tax=Aspergillus cristatus TaxID=573508 RepID=A0A1E3B9B6_ASPCR|nr:hypothetical protein SI65_07212 [Aspergillus cristatus]
MSLKLSNQGNVKVDEFMPTQNAPPGTICEASEHYRILQNYESGAYLHSLLPRSVNGNIFRLVNLERLKLGLGRLEKLSKKNLWMIFVLWINHASIADPGN